jgi:hypothetical protein
MNDPTFVEASRMLAERMIHEGGKSSVARIKRGFRLVTGRVPNGQELSILRALLQKTTPDYADAQQAEALLSVGEEPRDPKLPESELATWTVVASAIMNLDEAITKE